jgi:RNA polymerase sigma-70 factor (ECF subfamily)
VRDEDADDVLQEVFGAVAWSVAGFQAERAGTTFRAWLRGITRNKLLEHLRRRGRHPEAQGGTDAHRQLAALPDAAEDDPPEEVSDLYHRALELVRGEFENRTWEAFWRATVDGHPVDLIAADLGVSTAAVRKSKSRVLRRLKEEVGDLL